MSKKVEDLQKADVDYFEPNTNEDIRPEKTEEEKKLEILEQEYHKLSLIAAVLEQRVKIQQLTSMLQPKEEKSREEAKVKRVTTDY